jgi:hypothetical protein
MRGMLAPSASPRAVTIWIYATEYLTNRWLHRFSPLPEW